MARGMIGSLAILSSYQNLEGRMRMEKIRRGTWVQSIIGKYRSIETWVDMQELTTGMLLLEINGEFVDAEPVDAQIEVSLDTPIELQEIAEESDEDLLNNLATEVATEQMVQDIGY